MNPLKRRYLPYAVALLALAALVVIALPSAQAQQANGQTENVGSTTPSVVPFGAPASTSLDVYLRYTTGTASPTQSITVQPQVSGDPSWLSVSVTPGTTTFQVGGDDATGGTGEDDSGRTEARTFTVSFAATKQAPAQQPVDVDVTFQVSAPDGSQMDTNDVNVPFTVTAEYFSIVSFQQPSPFQRVGPTEAANFPLKITNSGNGETLFNFDIVDVGYEQWQVPTPSQMSVPATQTGAETNTKQMNLQVTTALSTGYYNDLGVVTMEMTPVFAPRPSHNPGVQTAVSFLTHFQGMYVSMIGPAGVLAAAGSATALIRLKQRRD